MYHPFSCLFFVLFVALIVVVLILDLVLRLNLGATKSSNLYALCASGSPGGAGRCGVVAENRGREREDGEFPAGGYFLEAFAHQRCDE